ncbi:DoxX family protein [Phytoactinopolyspora limicola]|uniref:DoxX family protein n=1 Tax=Phytoactinopolyspora limicola TaxID=2715536 RepID=UPI00140E5CAE|nr:DoxX family protein [Phytoactinopolyspora limicola]
MIEDTTIHTRISETARKRNRNLWIIQGITAGSFFIAGLSKLIFHVEIFDQIGWGSWFQYFTGVVQIVGAVALVIPRLSGLAGLAFVGLALCALGFHGPVLDITPIPIMLLGVMAGIIAWGRRDTLSRLFGRS